MSASLVGSEMCIRDRVHCVPAAPGLGQLDRVLQRYPRPAPSVYRQTHTVCLLYTSDAADDM
eukprot:15091281-Alexandrium_andersonii.AAC.1